MKSGYVNGKHYTEYVETVNELKQKGKYEQAISLLIQLVEATEEESGAEGLGVAPWYYEQLSILYKRIKNRDGELNILKRFAQRKHAPGVKPIKLLERLNRLLEKNPK